MLRIPFALLLLVGCGDANTDADASGMDAASPMDAEIGLDAHEDAGEEPDANVPEDAGEDAGGEEDAGGGVDGGMDAGQPDAGPSDAGSDAGMFCMSDAECADGLHCSGTELCVPGAVGADPFGCVPGTAPCTAAQLCDEIADRCVTLMCVTPPAGTIPPRPRCTTDANCTAGTTCNGTERCLPTDPGADIYGCTVTGTPCAATCTTSRDRDADSHDSIACGGDDCDDFDAQRYPGAVEICSTNTHDEDCDFSTHGRRDSDGDGYDADTCCNYDRVSRRATCGDDCNDIRADVHPSLAEVCDLVDNDCDGLIDEGVQAMIYADADGDGYGVTSCTFRRCAGLTGYASSGGDCNDANPALVPGSVVCGATPEAVRVCSGGTWIDSRCTTGTTCVPQPDGTGICQR